MRKHSADATLKSIEDQYADQIYKRLFDTSGNLINDPQLHIVIAVLNIDTSELHEKPFEYFKQPGLTEDVIQVRWEYHVKKRKTKLF
mmetsp:Transcript_29621/g.45160  ORF Transcript_29621/g.45160 Transcript_29621/m.45160 type:complete len:87 (+) Transcript_29621:52-312(+)